MRTRSLRTSLYSNALSLGLLALVLLTGCTATTESTGPLHDEVSLSELFWSSQDLEGGITYDVSRDGTTDVHLIRASTDNTLLDVGTTTTRFSTTLSADSLLADSITLSSLFQLPPQLTLTTSEHSAFFRLHPIAIHTTQSKRLLVALKDSVLYSDDEQSWHSAMTPGVAFVRFAEDSTGTLYAADSSNIYTSRDNGVSWAASIATQKGDLISGLECRSNGDLFVSYRYLGGVQHSIGGVGPFAPFQQFEAGFAAMALRERPKFQVFATADSLQIFDDSSHIYGVEIKAQYLVGANYSLLYASFADGEVDFVIDPLATGWTAPTRTTGPAIVHMIWDGDSGVYVSRTHGAIEHHLLSEVRTVGTTVWDSPCIGLGPNQDVIIGTDTALFRQQSGSSAPERIGPKTTVKHPNALLLLVRRDGGLHVGDGWRAGELASSLTPNSIPITARVMDHVDSLVIRGTDSTGVIRRGESYVVRYSYESNNALTMPYYWLAYYTKGLGPVLIESYDGTSGTYVLRNRAVRR